MVEGAARIFRDKCSAFDTTNALESTSTGADCANLLRCRPAHGPSRHSTPGTTTVASEIGPVRLHAYDWANLCTGHAGGWWPVPVGLRANGTRPRLAQSWPTRR